MSIARRALAACYDRSRLGGVFERIELTWIKWQIGIHSNIAKTTPAATTLASPSKIARRKFPNRGASKLLKEDFGSWRRSPSKIARRKFPTRGASKLLKEDFRAKLAKKSIEERAQKISQPMRVENTVTKIWNLEWQLLSIKVINQISTRLHPLKFNFPFYSLVHKYHLIFCEIVSIQRGIHVSTVAWTAFQWNGFRSREISLSKIIERGKLSYYRNDGDWNCKIPLIYFPWNECGKYRGLWWQM